MVCASAQEVVFHGRVLCEVGDVASKDGVFADAVSSRVVAVTHASTNMHVRARVWRRHYLLLDAAVLNKASLLRHHKLVRLIIRHVVHDK